MAKFKNKYRIESNRLKGWDYGADALYFVTICCKNRECFFGEVKNWQMILSEIGKFAEKCWFEIPEHFPFVKLGEFVVMPNHIHGIIEIAKNNDGNDDDDGNDDERNVETQNFASLPPTAPPNQPFKNTFGPQSKNLASIIRGYKIGVTKMAKKTNPNWEWQPNYHDHIIRDDKSYQNISNYIINNPIKWESDKFNQKNHNSDK